MATRSPKKEDAAEALEDLLPELRKSLGMTQLDLSRVLSVSPKTVARWENREGGPDGLQRHGVVATIATAAPAFHARVAAALGVEIAPAAVPPAPNMAILKAALDGALFEATETLGAPPQKVREAILVVLERVALIGVDPKTAAKLIAGKA